MVKIYTSSRTDHGFSKTPAAVLFTYIAHQTIKSLFKDEEKFVEMFKTGKGLKMETPPRIVEGGTARFFFNQVMLAI